MSENPPKIRIKTPEEQERVLPKDKQGAAYSIDTHAPYSASEVAQLNKAHGRYETSIQKVEVAEMSDEKKESKRSQLEAKREKTLDTIESSNRERAGIVSAGDPEQSPRERKKEHNKFGLFDRSDQEVAKQQESQRRVNKVYAESQVEAVVAKSEIARIESETYQPETHTNMDIVRQGVKEGARVGDVEAMFAARQTALKQALEHAGNDPTHIEKIKTSDAQKEVIEKLGHASLADTAWSEKKEVFAAKNSFEKFESSVPHALDTALGDGFMDRYTKRDLKHALNLEKVEQSNNPPFIKGLRNLGYKTARVASEGGSYGAGVLGAVGLGVGFLALFGVNAFLNMITKQARKRMPKFMGDWFYGTPKKAHIRGGGGGKKEK